jgi:hypothetical protein
VSHFCCEDMALHASHNCPDHSDPFDCPDSVIIRHRDGSFGLPVHDGGSSSIGINRCPWCATTLPRNRDDLTGAATRLPLQRDWRVGTFVQVERRMYRLPPA